MTPIFVCIDDNETAVDRFKKYCETHSDITCDKELETRISDASSFATMLMKIPDVKGPRIFLLDLNLGLPSRIRNEYKEDISFDVSKYEDISIDGIYLAKVIIDNESIAPVLIMLITSVGKTDDIISTIEAYAFLKGRTDVKVVSGHYLTAKVDFTDINIKQALREWYRHFGDLIRWFLNPPGSDEYAEIQWFDANIPGNDGSHNTGKGFYEVQLNASQQKLGRNLSEVSAKILLHSVGFSVRQGRSEKKVPAIILRSLFDDRLNLMNDLEKKLIVLPTQPALIFLLAIKRFLDNLSNTTQTYILKYVDKSEGVLAIGIENKEKNWVLARDIWKMCEVPIAGDTKNLFWDALHAKIDSAEYLGNIPLKPLLNGTKTSCAFPWITDNFIGVSWKQPDGEIS